MGTVANQALNQLFRINALAVHLQHMAELNS
jgi:hypothetical protein